MTETNEALLAGLPGDVRALLARPGGLSTRIFRLTHPRGGETVQRRQSRSRPTRAQRKGRR